MPSTTQCQKPEPVGASGSKQVTAKLLVSAGKPDQRSDGEMFPPVMPNPSKTWLSDIISPSATSSLRTSNDGTGGMKSWGSGGRSAMACLLIEGYCFGRSWAGSPVSVSPVRAGPQAHVYAHPQPLPA